MRFATTVACRHFHTALASLSMSIAETIRRGPSSPFLICWLVIVAALCLAPTSQAETIAVPDNAVWSASTPDSAKLFENLQGGTLSDLLRLPLVDYPLRSSEPHDPLEPLLTVLTPLISEGESSLRNPFAGPAVMYAQREVSGEQALTIVLTVSDRLLIHQYVQRALPRLQREYSNVTRSRVGGADVHLLTRAPTGESTFTNPFAGELAWWNPAVFEPGQLLKRFDTLAVAVANRRLIVTTSLVAMRSAINSLATSRTILLDGSQTAALSNPPTNAPEGWMRVEIDVPAVLESARRAQRAADAQQRLGLDALQTIQATVVESDAAAGVSARVDIELTWSKTPGGLLGLLNFADAAPPRADELASNTLVYLGVSLAQQVTLDRLAEVFGELVPNAALPALFPMNLGADDQANASPLSNMLRPRGVAALSWGSTDPSQLGVWLQQAEPAAAAPIAAAWNALQPATIEDGSAPRANADGQWFSVTWTPGALDDSSSLTNNPRFAAAMSVIGPNVGLLWFDDERARIDQAIAASSKTQPDSEPHDLALLGAAGMTADELVQVRNQLGNRGAHALAISSRKNGLRITALRTVAAPPPPVANSAPTRER